MSIVAIVIWNKRSYMLYWKTTQFCINERLKDSKQERRVSLCDLLSFTQLAYMYSAAESEQQETLSFEYPQWLKIQENIVYNIKERGLWQPV